MSQNFDIVPHSLSHINHIVCISQILRVIGSLASGVVAYVSQDWRIIWWYGSVLNALIVPMWLFLNESPRWLLSKGQYDRAERSINFSAGLNGTNVRTGNSIGFIIAPKIIKKLPKSTV